MIWAAFTSEWTKLRRPTLLLGTFLGLAAAASLFVILLFTQASATGGIVSLHQLAQPGGLVIGVARAAMLLGVVAFGIAAAQVASEYSLGTLLRRGRRAHRGRGGRARPRRPDRRVVHRDRAR
jgi:ABC-2 type transport system permease protein